MPPTGAGRLDGLTFAVKDLIDVEGCVTGGGNPDWRAAARPAATSSPAVAALRTAGANFVGQTVTDELAFSLEGVNVHDGTPPNPAAPDRLPGGSSSGSASAVAAGLADFALGTDTGGSVRIPGSFCGLFAFRPTHGRITLDGVIPFAPSYDTLGWFARDTQVLARVGDVLLSERVSTPITQFVLVEDAFALADPEVAATLLAALPPALSSAPTIRLFDKGSAAWREAYRVLQGAEIWGNLGPWITERQPLFGPAIAERFADAATIGAAEVAQWQPVRDAIRSRVRAYCPPGTALVLPTSPTTALPRNAKSIAIGDFYARALPMTAIAGHGGLPQVTIPLVQIAGAPVGLSLIASAGADEALLVTVARMFESLRAAPRFRDSEGIQRSVSATPQDRSSRTS
ncbi:amidase [Methylobacterium gnaphalii]|uniref:Amidase n=1 Tax=Methylobacterium gnaphalii TaxID=1010610 RepID=A0A512JMP0_9HYPH|nr:amidase [Methylobacterium gnaphalii]GLS49687.1 amidase [Methylobacterium gnaphalii]